MNTPVALSGTSIHALDEGVSRWVGDVPWQCWATVFGSLCITVGIFWDISWHATIGRDTFWTPAHLLIYLGGSLGGIVCGWLAFRLTFLERNSLGIPAVSILGFRAPLGAWVTIWGALAMLTSAPLDNWWHEAYGLDVKILSPPHAVLALGMYQVVAGASMMVGSRLNNSAPNTPRGLVNLYIVSAGIQLALASVLLIELSFPNHQHNATFYMVSAAMYPAFLMGAAQTTHTRWPATKVSLVYMLLIALMVWILPLFPAEPKLAPIYNRITRMAPPAFPLLLCVPAFGIDLLVNRIGARRGWLRNAAMVVAGAAVFLLLFIPSQWWFSKFLISTSADNWFFAGRSFFGFMTRPGEWRHEFWGIRSNPLTWGAAGWAMLIAIGSGAIGLSVGQFLSRIRR